MSKFTLQLNQSYQHLQFYQTMSTRLQMQIQNTVRHLRWSFCLNDVVLRGIHRKVDICQTDYSIHSKLRIFFCLDARCGSFLLFDFLLFNIFYTHQTSGLCTGECTCDCTHQMKKTVMMPVGKGATQLFVVCAVGRIMLGRSVIIIILSFRISTCKNKNIDHLVKKTFAIMSTQVTSISLYL